MAMCARTNRSAADPAADVTGPSEHKPRHGPACGDHSTVHGLITYLAARFLAVAPGAIDDTVVDSLRQIAELFHLDRALLWRNPADDSGEVASYSWARHHQRPLPAPLALASLPFIVSGLAAGEATWFTRIDEVTDPTDREVLLRYGLRSAAVFPVAPMGDTSQYRVPSPWARCRHRTIGRRRSSSNYNSSRQCLARRWRARPAWRRCSARSKRSASCASASPKKRCSVTQSYSLAASSRA